MISIRQLITLALPIILITSCTKKPEAIISSSSTSIILGDEVTFTNTSENAESYKWDFGDGITTSVKDPTHTYKKTGDYTVTLTAFSKKEKKSDVTELMISVKPEFPVGSSAIKFKGSEYPLYTDCYLFSSNNYTLTSTGNNGNLICNIYLPAQPQEEKTYNLKNNKLSLADNEACIIIQEKVSGSSDVLWASVSGELKVSIVSGKVSAWFTKINFQDPGLTNTIMCSGQATCQ